MIAIEYVSLSHDHENKNINWTIIIQGQLYYVIVIM